MGRLSARIGNILADTNGFMPIASIYYADTSTLENDNLFYQLYDLVKPYRKDKINRLHSQKDKYLSLCAEYLLMCACAEHGIHYRDKEILLGSQGKPYFLDFPIYFNLSHSGNKAMCVMSKYEAGCDIQKIGNCNMNIAKRFFSEEEYTALLHCESDEVKNQLFYRIWTFKESFIKCVGEGLAFPLKSISYTMNGNIQKEYSYEGNRYLLFAGQIGNEYLYSICIRMHSDSNETYENIKKQIQISEESILNWKNKQVDKLT